MYKQLREQGECLVTRSSRGVTWDLSRQRMLRATGMDRTVERKAGVRPGSI